MARCEECLHYNLCVDTEARHLKIILLGDKSERCKQFMPTADVVPKSEVEGLYKEIDRLSQVVLYHDSFKADEIKDAKVEVAREIFEEIEQETKNHGITYTQRKIAELKKKYTEEEK